MAIKPAFYLIFGLYKKIPEQNRTKDFFQILLAVTFASLVVGGVMLVLNSLRDLSCFPRMLSFTIG